MICFLRRAIACLTMSCVVIGPFVPLSAAEPASANPYAQETKQQHDARMKWWREARFGMFIHWGVYSVPAGTYHGKQIGGIGEWIMNRGKIPVAEYKSFAKQFNPVKYDADQWVQLAKEAGMKYIVITSKHHDGFAMFDSKVTDWDIVDAAPYGKDVLKPLSEACRRHGLKLGFYYSQAQDWNHPGGAAAGGHWDPAQDGDMTKYIRQIAVPQVKEILSNYGPIAVLWWDTPIDMTKERADMLLPLLALQPGIIWNNRLGSGYQGDLSTPEQHIPATGLDVDWETCMTMNGTWGYKSYDNNWKSTETLVRNLVDIASKGGNYLLNVGPTSEGLIPGPSVQRLKQIGKWMKVYGDSIYATTASPFSTKLAWGRCTKKLRDNGATLYLHVFDWPSDKTLLIPGLKNKVRDARLMANQQQLTTESSPDGVIVHLPAQQLDAIDTVLVIDVDGPLDIAKVLPKPAANGALTLPAQSADIHNPGQNAGARVESKYGKPNIGFWLDPKSWIEWSFKIDKPGTYNATIEVAVPGDHVSVNVAIGDRQIPVELPKTGDYGKYKKASIGPFSLERPGIFTIQVKPVAKGWRPINLRSIVLEPVK